MERWPLLQSAWEKGSSRQEISGAFGDAGILLPLALSLILVNGLNPTSVFLGVGLVYIATGLFFRIPMPVQPLKAVASIAIAGTLSPDLISAAGILMGLTLLLLSLTGAIELVGRLVSVPVIKGIQLTLALLLLRGGLELVWSSRLVPGLPPAVISIGGMDLPASVLLGLGSLSVLVALLNRPLLPASLALIGGGLSLGSMMGAQVTVSWNDIGPIMPSIALPSAATLGTAFVLLVLPQLPLSLGNAILSTADVARDYFGARAARVTPKRLGMSIGLANLGIGLIAGMPICHGAGGLTAHYRFGARTPLASVIIGSTCLVTGLVFGKAIVSVLSAMPYAVLGALLLYVGWRHLGLVTKVRQTSDYLMVFTVAGASTLTNNLAVGFALGVAVDWAFRYIRTRFSSRPLTHPTQAD